jgi:exonuclease SbcC
MRLRKAVFTNFCQHNREVEFADGLTFILGPNGSGKTNLLNGIVWCLTGVDRNAGVKADNVDLSANPGAPAGVRVFFEHDGAEVEVYRSLRRASPSVRVNGGKPVSGDRASRDLLRKVLGVPERVLLNYVFVAQRCVFDFLEDNRVEVAASLAQLFGTERAVLLYDLLGEAHAPATVTWGSDAIAVRLERLRKDLADAEATVQELAHLPEPWVESDSPEYAACEALRGRRQLRAELADCQAREATAAEEARRLLAVKDDRAANYQAAQAQAAADQSNAESARADLQSWRLYRRLAETVAGRQRRRETLLRQREELLRTEPLRPEDYVEGQDVHERLAALNTEATALRRFLHSWENTGKAACGECGTPTAAIAPRVPAARARLQEIGPQVEAGQRAWQRSADYRSALAVYQSRLVELGAQLAALEACEPVDLPGPPELAEEGLRQIVSAAEATALGLPPLQGALQQATLEWQRAEGRLAQWRQAAENKRRELHAPAAVADEDYDKALAALAAAREAARRRDGALVAANYLRATVTQDEALLAEARAAHARAARAEELARHLGELREVFHRDGLARDVAEGYVAAIRDGTADQPGVNDLLASFDAPFRAADFVDWRYRVRLASGKEHSALRLSDGQKVLLALAFRVVVNSLFARELGLLCLDEPTAGLDEDNRACLDTALGRLRELSKSRGLQVILVTHDRDVSTSDRCYRLAAAR